ncbi:hypothetical protein ACFYTQ_37465 [Nocardia sp. NPDC004068]|uniref:hypothetical protein n=1 Tax=Nocardia sp. NPDC004068 TaxID=3364303 RepID=UPI0036A04C0E
MIAKLLMAHWSGFPGRLVLGWVGAYWPLLAVVSVAVGALGGCVVWWARGVRSAEAARAVWLSVQTPVSVAAGDSAGVFVRGVVGALHRTRRVGVGARHVVLEVVASAEGARLGVWVPPRVDRAQIAAAITSAWPGAVVTCVTAPPLVRGRRVTAVEVTARQGVWAPWIQPRSAGRPPLGGDPFGGVLERLSARASGEVGFVQLVLGTYHRATVARFAGKAVVAVLSELLALVRFAVYGPRTTAAPARSGSGAAVSVSPYAAARQRALAAKQAAGLHVTATLRVGVASDGPLPRGRAVAASIAGGFDAIADSDDSGGLVTHRARAAAYRVSARRPGRAFVATVAEVAALWHLPADAARYGLPVTRSRTRAARPGLPRPTGSLVMPRPWYEKR